MSKEIVWLILPRLQQPTGLWSSNTGITAFAVFFFLLQYSVLFYAAVARRGGLTTITQSNSLILKTINGSWRSKSHAGSCSPEGQGCPATVKRTNAYVHRTQRVKFQWRLALAGVLCCQDGQSRRRSSTSLPRGSKQTRKTRTGQTLCRISGILFHFSSGSRSYQHSFSFQDPQ